MGRIETNDGLHAHALHGHTALDAGVVAPAGDRPEGSLVENFLWIRIDHDGVDHCARLGDRELYDHPALDPAV
jgi:hypothetical protein